MMKELVFEYKDIITNADFIIDLLEIVLKNSLMEFDGEYFQQIFGIIMGTNVAPILANLYLAELKKMLKEKTKNDPKMIWPTFLEDTLMMDSALQKVRKPILNIGFWPLTLW